MERIPSKFDVHPLGESQKTSNEVAKPVKIKNQFDTYAGTVHVEWDEQEPVTPMGQLVFFINFLKQHKLFDDWVNDCPLHFTSPNSSKPVDILGTLFLSALSGQKRYAHITSIRNDTVNPQLLGMNKVVSEDSVRRAFRHVDPEDCERWQKKHLTKCYAPLFKEPWILDVDTTVKVLYGNQEGAKVAYNPKKPGRPSHSLHTYMMGETRIVLDTDLQPGDQSSAKYGMPGLWAILNEAKTNDNIQLPALVRGDCAYGNENIISPFEEAGVNYLFKIRKTKKVKELIDFVSSKGSDWVDAGQGWSGIAGELQLSGWTGKRKVIVLRRELPRKNGRPSNDEKQLLLPFLSQIEKGERYEYSVLLTSLHLSVFSIAQLYRDRSDSENVFDELKNQWGWGGFVTKDLHRSRITARAIAQVYNWWALFVRLVNADKHSEGITSRPLMLYGVARRTVSGRQTTLKITSMHGKNEQQRKRIAWVNSVFNWFKKFTEQLTQSVRWDLMLSIIYRKFLKGRLLGDAGRLEHPPPLTELLT
jgi:Transposase DDE domain group 1